MFQVGSSQISMTQTISYFWWSSGSLLLLLVLTTWFTQTSIGKSLRLLMIGSMEVLVYPGNFLMLINSETSSTRPILPFLCIC